MTFEWILLRPVAAIAGALVLFVLTPAGPPPGAQAASAGEQEAVAASAGEQEAVAVARELISVTGGAKAVRQVLTITAHDLGQSPAGTGSVDARKQAKLIQDFMAFAATRTKPLIDNMAENYAKHFTVSEMREVIAFYHSTTGQKFIAKVPILMQEGATFGRQWGADLMREFSATMRKGAGAAQ